MNSNRVGPPPEGQDQVPPDSSDQKPNQSNNAQIPPGPGPPPTPEGPPPAPAGPPYAPAGPPYAPAGHPHVPTGQPYPPVGQPCPPVCVQQPHMGQYPPGQEPVMQPGAGQPVVQWMEPPAPLVGCPPGLEYLAQIDQLVVKQQIELLELISGLEMENKYRVFNNIGQQVYQVNEESECCMRIFCGPGRGFEMSIKDNNGQEVMRFRRKFKCFGAGLSCLICCDMCAAVLEVEAPPGQLIGYVKQEWSPWKPRFALHKADDCILARINGPLCLFNTPFCGDINFNVMASDERTQIGRVAKQWSGLLREWLTDADTFSISFPMDMDVRMKAIMFGALFLIDFMYFEKSGNK